MENISFQKVLANFIGESLIIRLNLLFKFQHCCAYLQPRESSSQYTSTRRKNLRRKNRVSETRAVKRLISSIHRLCTRDDIDELSSRIIIGRVKDFMSMIPRADEHKAKKYFQEFWLSDLLEDLVSLLKSPIKAKREAGEESIKVFLTPNINIFPKYIRNYCAQIVLGFCMNIGALHHGFKLPLYRSCRNTYGLLLKSIGYRNKEKYIYGEKPYGSIIILSTFVKELADKLFTGLKFINKSPLSSELPNYFRLSFESDLREFTLFSLHMRKAIEYHIKSIGQSLPVNIDEQPILSAYIKSFYLGILTKLNFRLGRCLDKLNDRIVRSDFKCNFNPRWLYYLSIMKQVNYTYKLFREEDIQISKHVHRNCLAMAMLIVFSREVVSTDGFSSIEI
ncbi:hypothetical protein MKW92_033599 [Papaver armeniacum]|nr:hypothetical protein MKW92_033599 [Papaver armeniacum]